MEQVKSFTAQYGLKIPEAYANFLVNVANGGYPISHQWCQIPELDGLTLATAKVHGLYGISHPDPTYNLGDYLSREWSLNNKLFKFGWDEGGNSYCIKMELAPIGEICLLEFGATEQDLPDATYRIAADFEAFMTSLLEVEPDEIP